MSIAIVCPIGTLAENGYQHIAEPCIKSQAEFADAVYLVQSHPDVRNLGWKPKNAVLVSNPYTWLTNGYDNAQLCRNVDMGFQMAKDAGHSVAFMMASNAYIPKHHMARLRVMLEEFSSESVSAWDYYPRGNLIGGKLFQPSKILPYVVKLDAFPDVRVSFVPDGLYEYGKFKTPTYGNYVAYEKSCIVDVPLEMTLDEFAAKMNWVRCFADVMPKRKPVMEWDYWRNYHAVKVGKMIPSDDILDDYGQEILARTRPEFISHEILRTVGGYDATE